MGSETRRLHVFFLPLMEQGHFIPLIDIAKLFALHQGVYVSIITTPLNAARIHSTIDQTRLSGHRDITIHLLQFPSSEAGLPDGCESFDDAPTSLEMMMAFHKATSLLHQPFERLVDCHRPDCIVSDMMFPWTVDVAEKFRVPRLVFHGFGYFSVCASHSIQQYSPHESAPAATKTQPFLVPKLPHPIEMTKSQLPDFVKTQYPFKEIMDKVKDADKRSYGLIMNSFYELEPDYVKHYKEEVNSSNRSWHVGPVSLCNRNQLDMAERGNKSSLDPNECLSWLGSREPASVIYVCFGSICTLGGAQLREIALALEASGRPFVWVVRKVDMMGEEWMPDGFEERTNGRGLIIKGWAPQAMILNHPAVGGFVTHCGWNSVLEGVTAGVPMVTWPLYAEQFYNEKLVSRVLGIGVEVGAQVWAMEKENRPVMGREEIEKAVTRLMGAEDEADERRRRAWELSEKAKRAMEKGGSSYMDLDCLIQELKMYSHRD